MLTFHYNLPVHLDPSAMPIDEANVTRMRSMGDRRRPRQTAIITDDFRVLGVRLAALGAGMKIPDDLLPVAVGGTFLAESDELAQRIAADPLIAEHIARLVIADDGELDSAACTWSFLPFSSSRSGRRRNRNHRGRGAFCSCDACVAFWSTVGKRRRRRRSHKKYRTHDVPNISIDRLRHPAVHRILRRRSHRPSRFPRDARQPYRAAFNTANASKIRSSKIFLPPTIGPGRTPPPSSTAGRTCWCDS